jgi:hypothetical protein
MRRHQIVWRVFTAVSQSYDVIEREVVKRHYRMTKGATPSTFRVGGTIQNVCQIYRTYRATHPPTSCAAIKP